MPRFKHKRVDGAITKVLAVHDSITVVMNTTTLAEVLERLRTERGWSQGDLAKRAGVSQSTIGNIESGARGAAGRMPASLPKIAGALDLSTDDLLAMAGLRGSKSASRRLGYDRNVESATQLSSFRAVPKISWVQAGDLVEMTDPYPPGWGEGVEWVDPNFGPHCVALTIKGNSMEPEFREGDVIIVDPDLQPQPGNCVVAKNGKNEATFKKYRPRGIGADGREVFELVPLNDDYPTLRSDQEPLRVIGVLVEQRKRWRRT